MAAVGENLRTKRLEARKSVRQLAADVGLSKAQISAIELGQVEFNAVYLHRFARALDTLVHELIPPDV